MARARITHRWADGSEIVSEIHVDPTFPDALDEARVQVHKLWQATCCDEESAATEDEA